VATITQQHPARSSPPETRPAGSRTSESHAARSGRPAAAARARPSQAPAVHAGPARAHDEALAPVSGILDIGDSNAFIRTSGYRLSPDDVYVSASQVRQYGLRKGDHIEGAAQLPGQGEDARQPGQGARRADRPARQGGNGRTGQENRNGRQGRARQKSSVLARVDRVNGLAPAQAKARPHFDGMTPLYAHDRIRLEAGSAASVARIIDLVSPVGKGQRGLIVSPPKAGKTMILKAIAQAITAGHPGVHLMMVLVGERPEEVTDIRRSVDGEIIYSTFDSAAADHIMVAELAIERAKRLVELGTDVVVLLDSITRLARAYNVAAPASSRILAGGVASSALQPPRTFLGAARNIEDGGSLTILSTALVETGSRMDDVFFEEFKGTGNMELRLRRDLAEKRLFPAIDLASSGTRRDDLLMSSDEYDAVGKLRRALASLDAQQGMERLLGMTRGTSSNVELLLQARGRRN
jgi:transcription termination factor Rho